MNNDLVGAVTPILSRLESAWNTADGAAFAEPFTTDADFVNIRCEFHHSKAAIGAGHQAIFDSVYKGCTVRYELEQAPLANAKRDSRPCESYLARATGAPGRRTQLAYHPCPGAARPGMEGDHLPQHLITA